MLKKPLGEEKDEVIKRLRVLRERKGLECKELSLLLGNEEQYISRMENGKFYPSHDSIEMIIKFCDSSLEELYYHDFELYKYDMKLLESMKAMSSKSRELILEFIKDVHSNRDAKGRA